jgi:transposase
MTKTTRTAATTKTKTAATTKTKTAATTKTKTAATPKTKTAATTKTKTAATTKTKTATGVHERASPLSVRRATRTAIPKTGSKAQRGLAVKDSTPQTIVGIDIGDRFCQTCFVAAGSGEIFDRGSVPTTKEGLTARFSSLPRARIALETGTHSPWIARLLAGLGHEVLVAHARKVRLITQNDKKNDDLDAERLALLARADPRLLHPIKPREEASQIGLAMLKARDSVVRIRSVLINTVRGLLKSTGCRLKKCDADVFHKRAEGNVPAALQPAILPLLTQIETLTASIRDYDKQVATMAKEDFPESELLSQVQGVGDLTALAYLLTVEDPRRFKDGGKVASYLSEGAM